MKRREFLISSAAAAAFAGTRALWAQGTNSPNPQQPVDPGKPADADPAKLARISIMTLNFSNVIKLPGQTENPDNPPRTLEVFDIAQMLADVYGVHNVEFQHSHIPSTESAYLKDLRAHIEKSKSRMQQINVEFGAGMTISTADPVGRVQAIDLTKRWIDHAVILNCPKVMVNQGTPSQENKPYAIDALKAMGDYARSKGVKISMETRGGGGGRRGAPPGAAGAATPPPAPPPAPAGPPAWVLLKDIIDASGTYSNIDIGGVGAQSQEALHAAIKALLPTNSGQMHIKLSPNWDLATAIKFTESLGYKGLYTIEINGYQGTRGAYMTILANI